MPLLLSQPNVKRETPLHIVARYGNDTMVKVLIEHAQAFQGDLENGVNNADVVKKCWRRRIMKGYGVA